MKQVKFLLTWFWGAGLIASWFVSHLTITNTFNLYALPILGTIVTAIAGVFYLINNWDK